MKLLVTALLSAAFIPAAFAADTCAVGEARYLQKTRALFDVGEVTRTNVAAAEYAYLVAKQACRPLPISDYCAEATSTLRIWHRGIREEARLGQYNEAQVEEVRRLREKTIRDCSPKRKPR